MRRTANLLLVAGLTASAVASAAAAPTRQGSKNCGEYDGIAVTKQESYEGPLSSHQVPLAGSDTDNSGSHMVLTDGAAKNDFTVTITWETMGDLDLYVYIDGEEAGSSINDQIVGGAEPTETVTVEDVPDCTEVEVRVVNFLAEPTEADAVIGLD